MVRKTERWTDITGPNAEELLRRYLLLQDRELPIVIAATLELALVEMIERRLRGSASELEEFLGTNGDGRAPAGSFGARIQLAMLLGLITRNDVAVLRSVKALRNIFAHRVTAKFSSKEVSKELLRLNHAWLKAMGNSIDRISKSSAELTGDTAAGKGLLLAVFAAYHFYFQDSVSDVGVVDALPHVLAEDG